MVGVTSEAEAPTQKFIDETKWKAAVVLEKSGKTTKEFGVTGYPTAALVDPKGIVVWKGHPSGLTDKIIEKHIKGATPPGSRSGSMGVSVDLPKKYKGLAKKLAKGQLGKGLVELEKLFTKQLDIETQQVLEAARKEVVSVLDGKNKAVDAAIDEKRYFDALTQLDVVAKHFAGHESSRTAKKQIAEIKKNKELKREIEAGKRIAKALDLIEKGKKKRAVSTLATILNGPLSDTAEAERARLLTKEHKS